MSMALNVLMALYLAAGLAAFAWTTRALAGKISNVRPAVVFFLYYAALTFGGALYFCFAEPEVGTPSSQRLAVLLVGTSYLLISAGLGLAAFLPKPSLVSLPFDLRPTRARIALMSAGFAVLGLYYYFVTNSHLAILKVLQGDLLGAYLIRSSGTNGIVRHGFLLTMPFKYGFPILSALCLLMSMASEAGFRRRGLRLASVFFFLICCSYTVLGIQKYYMMQTMVFLLICVAAFKGWSIDYKRMAFYFLASLVFLTMLVMGYVGYHPERLLSIPANLIRRIFTLNISILGAYMDYYSGHPLFYGHTFPNPASLFAYEPVSITKVISYEYLMSPEQKAAGIVGGAPTVFIGEMMLNFGYFGYALSCLIVGLFVGMLDGSFGRTFADTGGTRPIVPLLFFAYLMIWTGELADGTIFSILDYSTGLSLHIWIAAFVLIGVSRWIPKRSSGITPIRGDSRGPA